MELRCLEGNTKVKPDEFSYTLAVKPGVSSGDMAHVDRFLKRIESAGASPYIRTSNAMLHGWLDRTAPKRQSKWNEFLST